jgi:hypothetical protein
MNVAVLEVALGIDGTHLDLVAITDLRPDVRTLALLA